MRKSLKTIPALLLAGIFLCVSCLPAQAQPLESAPPIQLTAPSYLLADAETGAIIFEKDADTPRQVASLTKLMTALVTVETTSDLEQRASLSSQCYSNLIAANAGGMDLLEVAQIYQRSGLVLVYKLAQ